MQKKKMTETAAENVNQEEEDDEDECGYYYKPVVQPQVPIVDRTMGHANTHQYWVLTSKWLRKDTNESETQQENVLLGNDHQREDVQSIEEAQDASTVSPCPDSGEENKGMTY